MHLKVGFCIDSFQVGGTELNAVRTAEALVGTGIQLHVYHLHDDGPLRHRYEQLGLEMTHLPIRNLYSPRTAFLGAKFARSIVRKRLDLVHTHDLYTNIFLAPWAKVGARRRVLASRRWLYEAPRPGLVRLNRLSYHFSDRVLANSSSVARLLEREEGIAVDKIVEIPNFLSDRAFHVNSPELRQAKHSEWGLPGSAIVIGTVARLAKVKNHELALRALKTLAENVHLVLVGDGAMRQPLTQLANALGIANRVHFIGQVLSEDNIHQYFDIDLLCSTSEGFPNTLVEALAVARPVVASSVGGVPDVIKNDRNGLLFRSGDIAGLTAALSELVARPELRLRLGLAGLASVRNRFEQEVVISRLVEVYSDLAGVPISSRVATHD